MPTAYVKKLADKAGVSVEQAEKKWDAAKEAASKSVNKEKDEDRYWGTVTTIFKKMMGESQFFPSFREWSDLYKEE